GRWCPGGGAMRDCLDVDTILDFVTGRLSAEALTLMEQHADGCPTCLDLIATAAGTIPAEPSLHDPRRAVPRGGSPPTVRSRRPPANGGRLPAPRAAGLRGRGDRLPRPSPGLRRGGRPEDRAPAGARRDRVYPPRDPGPRPPAPPRRGPHPRPWR